MRQATAVWLKTGEVPLVPTAGFEGIYAQLVETAGIAFARRVYEQSKEFDPRLELKELTFEEFMHQWALEFIRGELVRQRIVSVSQSTRKTIVSAVERGLEEGHGQEKIAKIISDQVDTISRNRARVIARTEIHTAANAGSLEAAKHTGVPMRKQWLSVDDYRTRDFGEGDGEPDAYNHRTMDGQEVNLDEPFLMPVLGGGTIEAMYPGDPALPPAASINCRCAVTYTVDVGDLL